MTAYFCIPHRVIAGASVLAEMAADRDATVLRSTRPGREDCYDSHTLCRHQERMHGRGIRGGELVKSMYGWTVRADSGCQDFCILAGTTQRGGPLDGSLEAAEQWSVRWVNEDPTRRYVWART